MDYTTPLTAWGIPGFFILILAGVIIYQNRKIEQLYRDKDIIQEARRQDAKETTDKVTAPLQSISQTMQLVYDKLQSSKDNS